MDDRRKFLRFPVQLSGRYSEKGGEGWKECSVIDISREGMGLSIYSKEHISKGLFLKMEIDFPPQQVPIVVEGRLIWIKKLEDNTPFNYMGGVLLTTIAPEDKWKLMDYAYEGWSKREES